MDASKITQLLQKQNTRYINRCQTVDSSTLIWKNQIQSSKYIKGVPTCDGQQNCNVPTNPNCSDGNGICSFGGAGRTTAIQTGSPQQFLNVLAGASGSASQVYSSEAIVLQKAGRESCGVAGTNPAPENSYVVLPGGNPLTSNAELQVSSCSYLCTNTNGPVNNQNVPINNNLNPYLPAFDTYYKFKNPSAQCGYPVQDQNQKHFVKQCHSRFPNANNGVNAVFNPDTHTTFLNPVTKQFETYPYFGTQNVDGVVNVIPPTTDGNIIEPVENIIPLCLTCKWATYFNGTGFDYGWSNTTDSANNVIVTGQYTSTTPVTLQNATGLRTAPFQTPSLVTLPSTTNSAMFLVKYNEFGVVQWATYIDATGSDIGYSVTTDSNGDIYVAGQYTPSGAVTLYDANGTGQSPSSVTLAYVAGAGMFLVKYNNAGVVQWATYLDGTSTDIGYSVTVDSANYIYVTGQYISSLSTTVQDASGNTQTPSLITLPSTTSSSMFIIKYNSSGISQWATYLDASGADIGYSVDTDSSNNIYITGQYVASANINLMNVNGNTQTPSLITLQSTAGAAMFLIKYDLNGIAQWATYLDGSGADIGRGITVDSANNIYVTGYYTASTLFTLKDADINFPYQTTSNITLPSTSSNAMYIVKYNSNGIAQWATYIDAAAGDQGYSVTTDTFNNIYVAGYYNNNTTNQITLQSANGNISAPYQLPSLTKLPPSSSVSMFLVKYNSNGMVQCATIIDGTSSDVGFSVSTGSTGICVSGYYSSTTPVTVYNSDIYGITQYSAIKLPALTAGDRAMFLVKYV